MMRKKQVAIIIVTIMIGISLFGCGRKDERGSAGTPATEVTVATSTSEEEQSTPVAEKTAVEEVVSTDVTIGDTSPEDTEAQEEEYISVDAQGKDEGMPGFYRMIATDTGNEEEDAFNRLMSLNTYVFLTINEDGTGKMEFGNESRDLIWTDNTLIVDNEPAPYVYENGKVTLIIDDMKMIFTKLDKEALEAYDPNKAPLEPGNYDPNTRAGYYKIASMEGEGQVVNADILPLLGMDYYIVLNEDSTGIVSFGGLDAEVTWDNNFIYAAERLVYSYEKGRISLFAEGMSMTFVYVDRPEYAPQKGH